MSTTRQSAPSARGSRAITSLAIAAGFVLFLAATRPVQAQERPANAQSVDTVDARWTPWLGCWQLLEESEQDVSGEAELTSPPPALRATNGATVCVSPAADAAGVTLTTLFEQQAALEQTIVADGARHPITEPDCQGWQDAEWSRNGQRLFARAEIVCADRTPRTVSGLATMGAGPTWIDIQVIDIAGQKTVRVRRYRRIADQTLAARPTGSVPRVTPFTIDEVKALSVKLPPAVIEAALVETKARFDLNGKRLIELDEAGVADHVIDLMVALSFPKRFEVDRGTSGGGFLGGPTIDAYGYLWPYFYEPFGYSYLGRYDPLYFPGSTFIVVDGGREGIQPSGTGRVIDGLGYTRVRPRETSPHANGQISGEGGGVSGGASSGSSLGSSGGVSPQGYSGSGGDTGRTAQPRPPK